MSSLGRRLSKTKRPVGPFDRRSTHAESRTDSGRRPSNILTNSPPLCVTVIGLVTVRMTVTIYETRLSLRTNDLSLSAAMSLDASYVSESSQTERKCARRPLYPPIADHATTRRFRKNNIWNNVDCTCGYPCFVSTRGQSVRGLIAPTGRCLLN